MLTFLLTSCENVNIVQYFPTVTLVSGRKPHDHIIVYSFTFQCVTFLLFPCTIVQI